MPVLLFMLFHIFNFGFSKKGFETIRPQVSCCKQTEAVHNLMQRNIPKEFHPYFVLEVVEDCDAYIENHFMRIQSHALETGLTIIEISGNSGVSVAYGLNYYLKYFTNSQITWDERRYSMNHPLQEVDLIIQSLDQFRYF